MALIETGRTIGTRTVTPRTIQPGEEVTVRIELDGMSGKLLLTETVSDGDVIREVSPESVDTTRVDGVVYVSWNLAEPTDVAVEYTTSVAESATDGATIPFEGSVVLADETRPVGGRTETEVVADFFERLRRQKEITHHDVEVASQYADRGEITHRQFERVYQLWQNDSTFEPDEEYEPTVTATAAENRHGRADTTGDHQQMSRQGTPTGRQQRTGEREGMMGRQRPRSGGQPRTESAPREGSQSATGGDETSGFSRSMNPTLSKIPEAVVLYIVYGVFSVVGFFVMAVVVDATADFVTIPAGGAVAFVAAALVTAGGVVATVVGTGHGAQ